MKDFVTSDNAQIALIYIQKGKIFRQIKGFNAIFVQVSCFFTICLILWENFLKKN